MNIKKIAEGKFLLIIKSLGINEEFKDDGEAFRAGLGYISCKYRQRNLSFCLIFRINRGIILVSIKFGGGIYGF